MIKSLIEDTGVKMYIRKQALMSIVASFYNGQITREIIISYFKFLLNKKINQENIVEDETLLFFWWLIAICIDIYPRELRYDLDNSFKNNDYEYFKRLKSEMDFVLEIGEEVTLIRLNSYHDFDFIDDAMAELYAMRNGSNIFVG